MKMTRGFRMPLYSEIAHILFIQYYCNQCEFYQHYHSVDYILEGPVSFPRLQLFGVT